MSRTTIVFLLSLVVVGTTLGTYGLVFPRMAELRRADAEKSLQLGVRHMQELDLTDEARLKDGLESLAQRQSLRELLRERPGDAQARELWLAKLRTELAGLEAKLRELAPVRELVLLDAGCQVLGRHGPPEVEALPLSSDVPLQAAAREACRGRRLAFLAERQGGLTRVAGAPILDGERQRGALLMHSLLDDGLVRARLGEFSLGINVAYLSARGLAASDLSTARRDAIQSFLASRPEVLTRLLAGKPVGPELAGDLVVAGLPVSMSGGLGLAGVLGVRSIQRMNRPLDELAVYLFTAAGLGLLGLAFLTVLFGGGLSRGLVELRRQTDRLTGGLATGRREGRFEPRGPGQVRALAVALNRMLEARARCPAEAPREARRDPTGTDMDASMLALSAPVEGEAGQAPPVEGDAELESYFRKLFDEFRQAKALSGQPLDGKLVYERFRRKLERQEELLCARHGCPRVRFEVVTEAEQVNLRPILVR